MPFGMTGGLGSASITELKAMLGAEQTRLLGQLLGNSLKGAENALENPSVPQGLTKQALEIYREIAQRVVAKGEAAPGYATQVARLKVIEKAMEMVGK